MAISPGEWRTSDAKWNEIVDLWNREATNRGIPAGDFPSMLLLLQDLWDLMNDDAKRTQQVAHEAYQDLVDAVSNAQANVDALQAQLDATTDPGPAVR